MGKKDKKPEKDFDFDKVIAGLEDEMHAAGITLSRRQLLFIVRLVKACVGS